jgi:hypothetical protein
VSEPALPEKVVSLHRVLEESGVAHAFGGALALAYYGEPRTTHDIDLNIFLTARRSRRAFDALDSIGVTVALDAPRRTSMQRDQQLRVTWGRTPVDLFFSSLPLHRAMAAAARTVPFGTTTIPILSAEHLVVCKVVFDRRKDWLDLEQVLLLSESLDRAEVTHWLNEVIGADDHRAVRFARLAHEFGR